jgi:hypothetical protein
MGVDRIGSGWCPIAGLNYWFGRAVTDIKEVDILRYNLWENFNNKM